MKNETKITIPKKHAARLAIVYHDADGYWAETIPGYCILDSDPHGGCHVAHEDTQKELLKVLDSINKCDCNDCAERSAARKRSVS